MRDVVDRFDFDEGFDSVLALHKELMKMLTPDMSLYESVDPEENKDEEWAYYQFIGSVHTYRDAVDELAEELQSLIDNISVYYRDDFMSLLRDKLERKRNENIVHRYRNNGTESDQRSNTSGGRSC